MTRLRKLPAGVAERYHRSSYLHPAYTPDGTVVTDDFNPNHAPHRGISWIRAAAPGVENGWFLGECKEVSENVEIQAHAVQGGFRRSDFLLRFEAAAEPLEIAGAFGFLNISYPGLKSIRLEDRVVLFSGDATPD